MLSGGRKRGEVGRITQLTYNFIFIIGDGGELARWEDEFHHSICRKQLHNKPSHVLYASPASLPPSLPPSHFYIPVDNFAREVTVSGRRINVGLYVLFYCHLFTFSSLLSHLFIPFSSFSLSPSLSFFSFFGN